MSAFVPASPAPYRKPLTAEERERVGMLLDAVSTRTLLHSLAALADDREDARLIIAALIDRFPDV